MLTGKYWSVNQFVEVDFKYAKFIEISASTTEPVTTSTSEKPKSGMVEHIKCGSFSFATRNEILSKCVKLSAECSHVLTITQL